MYQSFTVPLEISVRRLRSRVLENEIVSPFIKAPLLNVTGRVEGGLLHLKGCGLEVEKFETGTGV